MSRPRAEILHRSLARSIVEELRASAAEPGARLAEAALAQRLGTSRSPVRGALGRLLEAGVAERAPDGRGFVLRRLPEAGSDPLPPNPKAEEDDRLYWRIASDRLAGALPDLIAEAELMRRYGAPRGTVHRTLLRVLAEGWIERAPAGGWRFLPLIDGPDGYDESYRFRRAIEPAALLDPGFALSPVVAARLRREQQGLLDRASSARAAPPDPREVFELNSGFHLALAQASNNRFFADAALRMARLRRLVGYVIALDTGRLVSQSREHLAILDRIEAGDLAGAAALLVQHLDAGRASKARLLKEARPDIAFRHLGPAPFPGESRS